MSAWANDCSVLCDVIICAASFAWARVRGRGRPRHTLLIIKGLLNFAFDTKGTFRTGLERC